MEGNTVDFCSEGFFSIQLSQANDLDLTPQVLRQMQGDHTQQLQQIMLVLSTNIPIIVSTNDLAVARSHLRVMARCNNQVLNRIVLNPRSDTSQLLGCFEQVSGSDSDKSRFEWVDSLLIKAMLEGGWVLIEGAHLTSAAVLDRLNGVLEDQGEFVVNEQGLVDNELRRIQPHKDFRIIFLLDDSGDLSLLSRALINRCQCLGLNYEQQELDVQKDRRPVLSCLEQQMRHDLIPIQVRQEKDLCMLHYLFTVLCSHGSVDKYRQILQRYDFYSLLMDASQNFQKDSALCALLKYLNTQELESQLNNPKLPSDFKRFLKEKSKMGRIDTVQLYLLLNAMATQANTLIKYMMEHFDNPICIDYQIPERIYSKQDISDYNQLSSSLMHGQLNPLTTVSCRSIQTGQTIAFLDNFGMKLLNDDKEFVAEVDQATAFEKLQSNSPNLILVNKQDSLCVEFEPLYSAFKTFKQANYLVSDGESVEPENDQMLIVSLKHDPFIKNVYASSNKFPIVDLLTNLTEMGRPFASLPASVYVLNQILHQLRQFKTIERILNDSQFDTEVEKIRDLVTNLADVPKELSRMDEELSLHKTVMRGQRIFEENQLRSQTMVKESLALKKSQVQIDNLQAQVKNLQRILPLDGRLDSLTQEQNLVKQIIEKTSQLQDEPTLVLTDEILSLLQALCLTMNHLHYGHIFNNLLVSVLDLTLQVRKNLQREVVLPSSIHASVSPVLRADSDQWAMMLAIRTISDKSIGIGVMEHFIQREVKSKMQNELIEDEKLEKQATMVNQVLESTMTMDQKTKEDVAKAKEMAAEEIELVFPSYFRELQEGMVGAMAMASVEAKKEQKPINIESVFEVLLELVNREEADYRSENLKLRLSSLLFDIQASERPLNILTDDPNLWLQDVRNIINDQLRQARTVAITDVTEVKLNEAYNFYHDSLSQEAKTFYQPMKTLLDRVMMLVEEWPSPILNDLAFMANYMLTQFTQETPLMKILTGMEILLGKIDEWESYASKNLNSLMNEELTIKQLIIRYRKIQILSWRNLLAFKRKAAIKKDVENVVRLIHIVEKQVFDDNLYGLKQLAEAEELFSMLDLFLRDSSLGSFGARLKAVQLLHDAIEMKMLEANQGVYGTKKIERAQIVLNCISFVLGYYSQFKERLRKTTERLDANAREKVKNLIDISKWSVAKFVQVKSNIDKTHRQLNNAIKQEEQVLTQNVSHLVLNSSRKKYVGGTGGDEMRSLDPEVANFSDQPEQPKLSIDSPKATVLAQLSHFMSTKILRRWPESAIEQTAVGMLNRLKVVRDLNQKHIQRRLLIDLLAFMKDQSLQSNFQRKITSHLFEQQLASELPAIMTERLRKYYYKSYELLLMMEGSSQVDEHSDVKNPDIIRMSSLSRCLFFQILQVNSHLQGIIGVRRKIKEAREECPMTADYDTESVCLGRLAEVRTLRAGIEDMVGDLSSRMAMLDHLDDNGHQKIELSVDGPDSQHVLTAMDRLRSQLSGKNERQEALLKVAREKLGSFETALNEVQDHPAAKENVDSSNIVKVAQVLLQELHKLIADLKDKDEVDDSTAGHTNIEDPAEELDIRQHLNFLSKIDDAAQKFGFVLSSEMKKQFQVRGTLGAGQLEQLKVCLRVAEHVEAYITAIVEQIGAYLVTLCKFSYLTQRVFIYLIYQGFCGQEDQDQQQQEQEQFFDGENCGMDDAKGDANKNVSKDIEHEEQLEGLKNYDSEDDDQDQQEKPEEKDGEDEEDNNDFEMQEDFDGDMEDEKPKSDEDKGDDEEEEPDDAMDQVDDMLDNDLWDKNMEDMEQKEDENNENDDQDEKREMDLGERELDDRNKIDNDEMAAGDHDQQKEADEDDKNSQEGEEAADSVQQDQDDGPDEEQEHDADEVPLNRPELVEEEERDEEQKSQEANDVDMSQLDSQEGADEEDENASEAQSGSDQADDDDGEGEDAEKRDDGDVDDSVTSMSLSQLGGDDDGAADEEEAAAQPTKAHNENDAAQDNQQSTGNQQDRPENAEFDAEGNDVLYQMAMQILDQDKQQQPPPPEDKKQAEKDLEKQQVADPKMQQNENPEQEKPEIDQNAPEDQAYEVDDQAEQIQGNLAADKVEHAHEQEDDASMKDEAEHFEKEQEMPEAQKTEQVLKENAPAEKQKPKQTKDQGDQADSEDDDVPMQGVEDLRQTYEDYLQDKKQQEQYEDEIPAMDVDHQPFGAVIDADFDYNAAKLLMRNMLEDWRSDAPEAKRSVELLSRFKQETCEASAALCEQLRIILEPQLSQQLQGNFKTGKRLNMRKVISFIASHYRNDKIWLRRTLPSKRDYKILLAIDDSLSMSEQSCGFFSLEAMVTLTEALHRLDVGKIAVSRIRDRLDLLQSFECQQSAERTAFALSQFKFTHSAKESHDFAMANFLKDCNQMLDVQNSASQSSGATSCPFVIILSDGRFNKGNVRRYLQEAREKGYLYIFVILDAPTDKGKGIMQLRSAVKGEKGIRLESYMADFPFEYYCVIRDLNNLSEALAKVLIQWFQLLDK